MSKAVPGEPTKGELRARFSGARRAMADPVRDGARAAVRDAVLERCRAEAWRCVAAYVPLRTEPGSLELLDGLLTLGVQVLVPLTLPDNDLDWTLWPGASEALELARTLGTAAIGDAETVLVPALAVATDGTRLGRGGGSYDRALPRCSESATLAALLFDDETVDSLPREAWDVPVAFVVSPSGWAAVGRGRNTGVRDVI